MRIEVRPFSVEGEVGRLGPQLPVRMKVLDELVLLEHPVD